MISLPKAPARYSQSEEQTFRGIVERALNERFVKGADIELGRGSAVTWTDDDGIRWRATLDPTGALITSSL